MTIQLPNYVKTALQTLSDAGFEGFVVGGCVRDIHLGKAPEDFDITTNATPKEMLEVFSDFRLIPTGIKHGTVTVIIDGKCLEITTYRVDGEYLDNRRPESVTFSRNIFDDLSRRDFTVNALAYNEKVGVLDLHGGLEDLKSGIIRCVGEPDKRFEEDALRIMRAIRFSSVLGFEIEEKTRHSIFKNAGRLTSISTERISVELLKLLCGKDATRILIEYRDVIAVIIPELKKTFDFDQNNKHHIYTVYDHMAYAVGYAECEPDIRLALLLHDIGKPDTYFTDSNGVGHFYGHGEVSAEIALPILERLRLSREMINTVYTLVRYHDCPIEPSRRIVRRRLNKFGEPVLRKLISVKAGDSKAHNPVYADRLDEIDEINAVINAVINDGDCFDMKSLKISGRDLKRMGMKAGPELGKVLDVLLREVVDGKLQNDFDALAKRAIELDEKIDWDV